MQRMSFKPGDLVRLISEPRQLRLERLVGQPSIVTGLDESFQPPKVIVAVFDPEQQDVARIRCRTEDLVPIKVHR